MGVAEAPDDRPGAADDRTGAEVPTGDAEQLLRRLAASDERSVRAVLSSARGTGTVLDRETRAMVQLSALLALGAATVSLRWAVDVASTAGVDDRRLVGVMLAVAGALGSAQTVSNAPRLALALGLDVEAVDGS
jgi:4-carboxymuconolactone decarboxylase